MPGCGSFWDVRSKNRVEIVFPAAGIEKRMVKMEICCIIEKIYKNDWEQEFYNE